MNKKQNGFSMIEVLVSLIILAIGLLGLAGLQMTNMKSIYSSGSRAQATVLAHDMLERLRLNPGPAIEGKYNVGYGEVPAVTPDTNANQVTPYKEVAEWKALIQEKLPGAQGDVNVTIIEGNVGVAKVSVKWNDARGSENSEDQIDGGLLEFTAVSRIN